MLLAAPTGAAGTQRRVELADIIRVHGQRYSQTHRLSSQQSKAIAAIEACRTATLGGHREYCQSCEFERFAYNSCRNRHCPKCQRLTKARWLEARRAELLPVPYFHVVFTLPHELNGLILHNQRAMLNLLFEAASRTLLQFGETRFGGKVGFTMILHTWDQMLRPHYHLHVLIPAGALLPDGTRWVAGQSTFLFPVRALGKVFRGKFTAGLRALSSRDRLCVSDSMFNQLLGSVRRKPWIVYAKKPFTGPEHTLEYLGRYTHRVAISNDRILRLHDDGVTFAYRDRAQGDIVRTMTLPAEQFIERFLQHVLPHGFMRIRHFGFLANRVKGDALAQCRLLLNVAPPTPLEPETIAECVMRLTGIDLDRCPRCGAAPIRRSRLRPMRDLRCRPPPIRLHSS